MFSLVNYLGVTLIPYHFIQPLTGQSLNLPLHCNDIFQTATCIKTSKSVGVLLTK
jgi:hypothetical protein